MRSTQETATHSPATSATQLAILFATRAVMNVTHRIIYPFLPSIARGLGVSLATAGSLVTVRLLAGVIAPLLGPLADRYSRRRVMATALLLLSAASLLLVSLGTFAAAAFAFVLFGLAKVLADTSVHGYLGDTVPYRQRGRAVGVVELSWSVSWLVGVPAAGFLMERFGWRAPWAVLTGLALLGVWPILAGLPLGAQPSPPPTQGMLHVGAGLVRHWRGLLRHRPIAVLLLVTPLLIAAVEIPLIVYGAWLETAFGLSLSALGLASIVLGLAEAAAEFGTTVITDRLGKKRSVLFGLLGLAAGLLVLPGLARFGLVAALAGLVLVMLGFEFSLVSLLPLATELAPETRASLLSLNIMAGSLGRMIGAVGGGWLWEWGRGGIAANAWVGASCALLAAALMAWGMVEIDE